MLARSDRFSSRTPSSKKAVAPAAARPAGSPRAPARSDSRQPAAQMALDEHARAVAGVRPAAKSRRNSGSGKFWKNECCHTGEVDVEQVVDQVGVVGRRRPAARRAVRGAQRRSARPARPATFGRRLGAESCGASALLAIGRARRGAAAAGPARAVVVGQRLHGGSGELAVRQPAGVGEVEARARASLAAAQAPHQLVALGAGDAAAMACTRRSSSSVACPACVSAAAVGELAQKRAGGREGCWREGEGVGISPLTCVSERLACSCCARDCGSAPARMRRRIFDRLALGRVL